MAQYQSANQVIQNHEKLNVFKKKYMYLQFLKKNL